MQVLILFLMTLMLVTLTYWGTTAYANDVDHVTYTLKDDREHSPEYNENAYYNWRDSQKKNKKKNPQDDALFQIYLKQTAVEKNSKHSLQKTSKKDSATKSNP